MSKRIGIVTTVDSSLHVMFPGLFRELRDRGYEVTGICADGPWVARVRAGGTRVITVPLRRDFAPGRDLQGLVHLWRIFRRERFDLIHYNTPKAALLAGLAGRLTRNTRLLYTLRGLGYWGYRGFKYTIGKRCERIACRCADRVICISRSLAEQAVAEGLVAAGRAEVLGAGSSRGVDLETYRLDDLTRAAGREIRESLGLRAGERLIGYAGRMAKEKGIERLVRAFQRLRGAHDDVHLLLIGHVDQRNPLDGETRAALDADPRIHVLPFTDELERYYAAMDIFVLPSDREGFGNALIEASAMELPVIGSDIPGCRDAVRPGRTGLLVDPRSQDELHEALARLVTSAELRRGLGRAGACWVRESFDRRVVWRNLIRVYEELLEPGRRVASRAPR